MPDSAAKTQLKMMTAWDDTPTLSDAEVDGLLSRHQVTDSAGVSPGGSGYVETYNLRAAAREGWTVKLGRAAKLQSTDLDGDRMSANQIFDQCERMIRRYSSASSAMMSTSTKEASDAACTA